MKAEFIGKDGSEGFVKGKEYEIETSVGSKLCSRDGLLWVNDKNSVLECPYTNLEKLLENWKLK